MHRSRVANSGVSGACAPLAHTQRPCRPRTSVASATSAGLLPCVCVVVPGGGGGGDACEAVLAGQVRASQSLHWRAWGFSRESDPLSAQNNACLLLQPARWPALPQLGAARGARPRSDVLVEVRGRWPSTAWLHAHGVHASSPHSAKDLAHVQTELLGASGSFVAEGHTCGVPARSQRRVHVGVCYSTTVTPRV